MAKAKAKAEAKPPTFLVRSEDLGKFNEWFPQLEHDLSKPEGRAALTQELAQALVQVADSSDEKKKVGMRKLAGILGGMRRTYPFSEVPQEVFAMSEGAKVVLQKSGYRIDWRSTDPRYWVTRAGYPVW